MFELEWVFLSLTEQDTTRKIVVLRILRRKNFKTYFYLSFAYSLLALITVSINQAIWWITWALKCQKIVLPGGNKRWDSARFGFKNIGLRCDKEKQEKGTK